MSINPNVLGLCEVDGFCPWKYFHLNEDSFVVDLGSFRGDFSKYILDTYNCRVDAYDPLNTPSISHPKFNFHLVPVFNGEEVNFTDTGSSSHILSDEGKLIKTLDIREITKEHIDLMKINIEGSEIVVLNLADLSYVDQIIVEFHLFRACEEDRELVKAEIFQVVNRIMSFGYKMYQMDIDSPAFMFTKI